MDASADQQHLKANCPLQTFFFKEIILQQKKNYQVDIFNTYEGKINLNDLKDYDAFMWTGGLGNIYEKNEFNSYQLKIAGEILKLNKPIWGSCWGLQVFVTVYGGKIIRSKKPEFGFSSNIHIKKSHPVYDNKLDYFTAPGHHYDVAVQLPKEFIILAENNYSIQSIYSESGNLFCTQYHPELPFSFIANLMVYWKKNYLKIMSEKSFKNLVSELRLLEINDIYKRKTELINWINYI